jgi:hypothetical protein
LFESFNPNIIFFHAYFEDILALPIILKSSQLILQRVFKPFRNFTLSAFDIILITAAVSVYFEGYLPTVDTRFTRDYLDIVAYLIGALIFAKWMNFPIPNIQSKSEII